MWALPTLRVLFFNVGNGLLRPDRLKHVIEQSEADLIGLAEVAPGQAEAARDLSEIYPYQFLHGTGIPGKGLLSRIPLRTAELIELHPRRPDLRASMMVGAERDEREIQIIVAHPPPQRTRCRDDQITALLQYAAKEAPSLLIGDFNMVQYQAIYRRFIAAGLVDSFREAGLGYGFTYPVRRSRFRLRPLLRIDFIWHTRHFRAERAWVGMDYGSDHLPIFAELAW